LTVIRGVIGDAVRFGAVGLAATAVHLALAFAARGLGAEVFLANVAGFLSGLAVSLAGHHHFSFQRRAPFRRSAMRFIPIAVLAFALNNGILATMLSLFGQRFADLSLAVAILAVPALSFVLARQFAYRPGGQA
jgi:putative flippase GtrA